MPGVSAQTPADLSAEDAALPAVHARLGYLLKHAQQRLAEVTAPALAPFGITGRELAVLMSIDDLTPLSQQDVADRLGVDRTTMVALVDGLEAKNLVTRRPQEGDRRRNVVELTDAGRDTLHRAGDAAAEAERRFLAPLSPAAAAEFIQSLRTLVPPPGT